MVGKRCVASMVQDAWRVVCRLRHVPRYVVVGPTSWSSERQRRVLVAGNLLMCPIKRVFPSHSTCHVFDVITCRVLSMLAGLR